MTPPAAQNSAPNDAPRPAQPAPNVMKVSVASLGVVGGERGVGIAIDEVGAAGWVLLFRSWVDGTGAICTTTCT